MNRFRITLAGLLLTIPPIALAFAALRSVSALWASAMYSLAIVGLLIGTLGALLRKGSARAFWVGFSLFGWGYWFLGFDPNPASITRYTGYTAYMTTSGTLPRMLTTDLLEWLRDQALRSRQPAVGSPVQVQWGNPTSYFPATVMARGDGQIQVRWQNYPPGSDEWVGSSRVQIGGGETYLAAGHSVFLLLFALLGGLMGRLFAGLREKDSLIKRETT